MPVGRKCKQWMRLGISRYDPRHWEDRETTETVRKKLKFGGITETDGIERCGSLHLCDFDSIITI